MITLAQLEAAQQERWEAELAVDQYSAEHQWNPIEGQPPEFRALTDAWKRAREKVDFLLSLARAGGAQ